MITVIGLRKRISTFLGNKTKVSRRKRPWGMELIFKWSRKKQKQTNKYIYVCIIYIYIFLHTYRNTHIHKNGGYTWSQQHVPPVTKATKAVGVTTTADCPTSQQQRPLISFSMVLSSRRPAGYLRAGGRQSKNCTGQS